MFFLCVEKLFLLKIHIINRLLGFWYLNVDKRDVCIIKSAFLDRLNRSNFHRMIRIYDFCDMDKKDSVIQASASRHHHGDSDEWDTGCIASVNRHECVRTINLLSL